MSIHPHEGERPGSTTASLVFSGGIGLGSYQAGACDALLSRPNARIGWIAAAALSACSMAPWSQAASRRL